LSENGAPRDTGHDPDGERDDDANLSALNDRTCIVTRKAGGRAGLIRFVAAPDGTVAPDLRGVLPGRGCWVTADRTTVALAVRRKLFARALKADVTPAPDLAERVEVLLAKSALGSLGLLRKAGSLLTGSAKVEDAVRRGRAAFVLHATDGAEDGIRKITQARRAVVALEGPDTPAFALFSSAEMSLAFGAENVIHAAAVAGGSAKGAAEKLSALALYRGAGRMDLN
jgi:hypothetical protein